MDNFIRGTLRKIDILTSSMLEKYEVTRDIYERKGFMLYIHKSPSEHFPSTYTSQIQYQYLLPNLQMPMDYF